MRLSQPLATMSLTEFLAADNTDEINGLFETLARLSFRVNMYVNLRARYNFITEVINNRYPNGLPCMTYINDIMSKLVPTGVDAEDEVCDEFLEKASEVETYILRRDEMFHSLQEIYLENLLEKNELQFRLAFADYHQYKQAVDYRWPTNLTKYNKLRMEVEERFQRVLQTPIFRALGT